MVAKADKTVAREPTPPTVVATPSNHHSRRNKSFTKPSWLLCNIADLDESLRMFTRKTPKENSPESFAARANSYYHERPQLLTLLQDLYNNYLSLADRYCRALSKNHHQSRCSSPIPLSKLKKEDNGEVIDDSDAESSTSQSPKKSKEIDHEMIVAELVMKTVEYDIILNELNVVENRCNDSSRKIELQKNLLDILDSERLVLLNDNATLGYRVNALVEENKGLVSESLFLKRKASELARCILKTREDHRVYMLSRKIEELQGQISGLEKKNKEYYEQLVMKKGETKYKKFSLNLKNVCDKNANGEKVLKFWEKVKKFDLVLCGSKFDPAGS